MQRRVVTSLEEDFEEIGLNRKVTDVGVFGSLDEELQVAERFGNTLEEPLKVQKMVRMSPAERALARADYRKQKSVIKRKRKKLHKKPAFKRHAKKLAKATKGKKKSPRKRFIVTGLEQIGSLQESIQQFAAELDGNKKDEMILALENVASVAGLLADRLDEAEAYVDEISEMQDAVCDTDEEFGDKEYGDVDNLKDVEDEYEDVDDGGDVGGGEMGDELAFLDDDDEEEMEDEEGEESEDEEDSDEALDIDDEEMEEAKDTEPAYMGKWSQGGFDFENGKWSNGEHFISMKRSGKSLGTHNYRHPVHSDIDDSEYLKDKADAMIREYKGSKTESKSNRISDNLRTLRTEAAELLQQFKKEAITPADAESVLRDMVSYLGGAINTFANIAKGLEGYRQETGQDQPKEVQSAKLDTEGEREIVGQDKDLGSEGKVDVEKEKRDVVGQDDPESVGKAPEGQSEKRKVAGEDAKLDSVGKEPEDQNEKRTVVGQDKIDDKLDMGTNKPQMNQVNQKGKGELSVIESHNLDRFTKELVESVAKGLNDENRKTFLALPKQKLIEAAYAVVGSKKKN